MGFPLNLIYNVFARWLYCNYCACRPLQLYVSYILVSVKMCVIFLNIYYGKVAQSGPRSQSGPLSVCRC